MDYPEAFLNGMKALLGDEFGAFAEALARPARAALRVNPLKPGAREAAAEFAEGRVAWEENGYYVREGAQPSKSVAHQAGMFYMQDASAMAPVNVLRPEPGDRVLDLCAAPGGNSGQIAARLMGSGILVSNEIDRQRAKALSGNLERLGVTNAFVLNETPARLAKRFPAYFDKILVDAPCSGEGMFRRDEGARAEWNENSPEGCAKRQAEILAEAAKMLRPGGRLVYSTCTFNRTENEGSIRAFLEKHKDFAPEEFTLNGVGESEAGCIRLWPHKIDGEGHFAACLTRTDGDAAPEEKPVKPTGESFRQELERETGLRLPDGSLMRYGDRLVLLPAGAPDVSGLTCVRAGLSVAEIGKGFLKPDHAAAMACACASETGLSEEEAARYLTGETVEAEGRGWTRVTCCGMPLGWGKLSGGQLKNHLPKGLRRNAR